jgi:hypothetical protein
MLKNEKVDRWAMKLANRPKPHPEGNRQYRRDIKFGRIKQEEKKETT